MVECVCNICGNNLGDETKLRNWGDKHAAKDGDYPYSFCGDCVKTHLYVGWAQGDVWVHKESTIAGSYLRKMGSFKPKPAPTPIKGASPVTIVLDDRVAEIAFFAKPNDSLNCICGCRRSVCAYHK